MALHSDFKDVFSIHLFPAFLGYSPLWCFAAATNRNNRAARRCVAADRADSAADHAAADHDVFDVPIWQVEQVHWSGHYQAGPNSLR